MGSSSEWFVLAGDFDLPPDSEILSPLLGRIPRCVLRGRPGIWLHRMAAGKLDIVRHPDPPRIDGGRLAVPSLLGGAGRGLRPSSPAGRPLARGDAKWQTLARSASEGSHRRVGQGRASFWWGCEADQSWSSTLWPSRPSCRDRSPTRTSVCLTHPTFGEKCGRPASRHRPALERKFQGSIDAVLPTDELSYLP